MADFVEGHFFFFFFSPFLLDDFGSFDLVVSRGFGRWNKWLEYTSKYGLTT